jgi:Sulfotransferase family
MKRMPSGSPGSQSRPPAAATPLFIVGSPRSGTSVLVDAAFAGGFSGFREGNLLGLLQPLYNRIDDHFNDFFLPGPDTEKTLIGQVPREMMRRAIRDIFKRKLDELHDRSPWLDKTCNPDTIRVVPDLVEMWPSCRIIFARRRGIENVLSRMKKFPERDFGYHCRDWAHNMSAWRQVRGGLEAWRFLEVDQYDLVTRPATVAREIASLLGLDEAAGGRIESTFRSRRPQQTAPGTAERLTPLRETCWTPAEIAQFTEVCGPEMAAYGYSLDATYWQDPAR